MLKGGAAEVGSTGASSPLLIAHKKATQLSKQCSDPPRQEAGGQPRAYCSVAWQLRQEAWRKPQGTAPPPSHALPACRGPAHLVPPLDSPHLHLAPALSVAPRHVGGAVPAHRQHVCQPLAPPRLIQQGLVVGGLAGVEVHPWGWGRGRQRVAAGAVLQVRDTPKAGLDSSKGRCRDSQQGLLPAWPRSVSKPPARRARPHCACSLQLAHSAGAASPHHFFCASDQASVHTWSSRSMASRASRPAALPGVGRTHRQAGSG